MDDSKQGGNEGDGREGEDDRLWMRAVSCVQWLEEADAERDPEVGRLRER